MEIPVEDTGLWTSNKYAIEKMLKFLLVIFGRFVSRRRKEALAKISTRPDTTQAIVVSLLSGGADSLVGALDLGFRNANG